MAHVRMVFEGEIPDRYVNKALAQLNNDPFARYVPVSVDVNDAGLEWHGRLYTTGLSRDEEEH